MAIGINSRLDLSATTYTTIATTPAAGKAQMLTVSLVNRSASAGTFRLAVVNNGSTTPTTGDFLDYDSPLASLATFERTGVVIQNGQTLVGYSSVASVSAVTYGLEDSVANTNTGSFKFNLSAATWTQATAGPASGRYQTVSLYFTNYTGSTSNIRVCISTTYNSPAAADYIEYDVGLAGTGQLERTGIVIGNGQQIGIYSSVAGINCVVMIVDDQ
jgi:hypothetical protein